jgi:hypothetical protein
MHTVLPPGALGSYTPGAHPMISEGGSERSYSEQVASRPDAPTWNTQVLQGKLVPLPCKWPPRTLIVPPALDECIGKGPT